MPAEGAGGGEVGLLVSRSTQIPVVSLSVLVLVSEVLVI